METAGAAGRLAQAGMVVVFQAAVAVVLVAASAEDFLVAEVALVEAVQVVPGKRFPICYFRLGI